MPILNYTTEIDVHKTVMEIQRILLRCKARSVQIEYDEGGNPVTIAFVIAIKGVPVQFRLKTHTEGVYRKIFHDPAVPRKLKTQEQAGRVAWRIKKDLLEAQTAAIEAEEAELAELFLSWAVDPHSGLTVYEEFYSRLALGSGETVDGKFDEVK